MIRILVFFLVIGLNFSVLAQTDPPKKPVPSQTAPAGAQKKVGISSASKKGALPVPSAKPTDPKGAAANPAVPGGKGPHPQGGMPGRTNVRVPKARPSGPIKRPEVRPRNPRFRPPGG